MTSVSVKLMSGEQALDGRCGDYQRVLARGATGGAAKPRTVVSTTMLCRQLSTQIRDCNGLTGGLSKD